MSLVLQGVQFGKRYHETSACVFKQGRGGKIFHSGETASAKALGQENAHLTHHGQLVLERNIDSMRLAEGLGQQSQVLQLNVATFFGGVRRDYGMGPGHQAC